ncbi:MAG: hypothetical protein JNK67_29980 [Alphaproteobacteria bacterium]|nr:hypothetical protein [Alphaproteobacteria bacterium]
MRSGIAKLGAIAAIGVGMAVTAAPGASALTCLSGSGTAVGNPIFGATIGTFEGLGIDATTTCIGNEVWAPPSGFTFGTYVKGADASGTTTDPTTLGAYTSGGDFATAANALDHKWVQDTSPNVGLGGIVGAGPSQGIIWDLGGPANKAVVFVMVDHGPVPGEVLENTAWLSNDPDAADGAWTPAVLKEVHGGGWAADPVVSDGFVAVYELPGGATFRYVSVTWGGPGAVVRDGDNEIDAVGGLTVEGGGLGTDVPAPMSLALLGGALLGLGGLRRRG